MVLRIIPELIIAIRQMESCVITDVTLDPIAIEVGLWIQWFTCWGWRRICVKAGWVKFCFSIPWIVWCPAKHWPLFRWSMGTLRWRWINTCGDPRDTTPPLGGTVTGRQLERNTVQCQWGGFSDSAKSTDSDIDYYEVALGTSPAASDVHPFVKVGTSLTHKFSGVQLPHFGKVYITVKAVNGEGLVTMVSSEPFVADNTLPHVSYLQILRALDGKFMPRPSPIGLIAENAIDPAGTPDPFIAVPTRHVEVRWQATEDVATSRLTFTEFKVVDKDTKQVMQVLHRMLMFDVLQSQRADVDH